jgi:hypothetical protein
VHQRGRVQRLARRLSRDLLRSQPPQLIVDERQKLFRRLRISLLNGRQAFHNRDHVGT